MLTMTWNPYLVSFIYISIKDTIQCYHICTSRCSKVPAIRETEISKAKGDTCLEFLLNLNTISMVRGYDTPGISERYISGNLVNNFDAGYD